MLNRGFTYLSQNEVLHMQGKLCSECLCVNKKTKGKSIIRERVEGGRLQALSSHTRLSALALDRFLNPQPRPGHHLRLRGPNSDCLAQINTSKFSVEPNCLHSSPPNDFAIIPKRRSLLSTLSLCCLGREIRNHLGARHTPAETQYVQN